MVNSGPSTPKNSLEYLPLSLECLIRLFILWPGRWPGQLSYFSQWVVSLSGDFTGSGQPWLPYELIDWLDEFCEPKHRVFEYGSGNSTLFFAERVHTIYSIEHDPDWYQKMLEHIAGKENVELTLKEPIQTKLTPEVRSEKSPYQGMDFYDYVHTIEDPSDGPYNLVLVDGRARSDCALLAMKHVADGGVLILDDAQRPRYKSARRKLTQHWQPPEVYDGLKPGCKGRAKTEVYRRP